jgi:hypothetical protein
VPQVIPVHALPLNDHVTPLAEGSFETIGVKLAVAPFKTVAEDGERVTDTPALPVMVIVADADFVESASEVAVRVTVARFGGAV